MIKQAMWGCRATKFLLHRCSAGHSFCTDVWQLFLHLACFGTTDKKETQTSKWLFALAGEPVNIKKQAASQHDGGRDAQGLLTALP